MLLIYLDWYMNSGVYLFWVLIHTTRIVAKPIGKNNQPLFSKKKLRPFFSFRYQKDKKRDKCKDLSIKNRTRIVVKLVLFLFKFLWISLYLRNYSQVPNKQVGPNTRVGWLFWENFINEQAQIKEKEWKIC